MYTGSALKRELNFFNSYLSLLYFWLTLVSLWLMLIKKREDRFCIDGKMMFLLRHFDAIITRKFYVFVVLIPPLKFLYLCKNVQWIQKLFELFCIIEFMYVGNFFNYLQGVAYSCKVFPIQQPKLKSSDKSDLHHFIWYML